MFILKHISLLKTSLGILDQKDAIEIKTGNCFYHGCRKLT